MGDRDHGAWRRRSGRAQGQAVQLEAAEVAKRSWSGAWKSVEPVVSSPRSEQCRAAAASAPRCGSRRNLDAVEPVGLERVDRGSTSSGSSTSQNGCAQTATPPAAWMTSIASATVGRVRATNAVAPGDDVGGEERVPAVDALGAQALPGSRGGRARRRRCAGGRSAGRPRGAPRAGASSSSKPSSRRRSAIASTRRPRSARKSSSVGSASVRDVELVAADMQVLVARRATAEISAAARAHAEPARRRGASGTPSTVSWSVSARSSTPAAAARSTTSAGGSAPSERGVGL